MALVKYLFVGGAQRTGTTMLQSLLCQSSRTNGMLGEASYLRGLVQAYQLGKLSFPNETADYFADVEALRRFHGRFVEQFLAEVLAQWPGAECLVLKEPHLTTLFPLLFELVPQAHFLFIMRDPRDAVASMVSVGERMKMRGEQHFFQQRDMHQLSDYYKSFYLPSVTYADARFKQQMRIVRYEDLVGHEPATLAAVRDFTGIELEGMAGENVDLGKFESLTKTERYEPWGTGKLGKPPVATSVGNYETVLSDAEVAQVEMYCRDFIAQFQYG